MTTNPEKIEGPKPEKKKRSAVPSVKKLKVNPKLSIVQDVIELMNEAQINELHFEQSGVKIHLRKGPGGPFMVETPAVSITSSPVASNPGPVSIPSADVPASVPVNNHITVSSPMVGTFYRSPAPDAKPFIEEGDKVEVGQVYCIIEAMKLMNEVKAEVAGKVVKIIAQNGQAVEFNQPLIVVDPS
jgi:oxaloacetate decarboxylase alpha subunit